MLTLDHLWLVLPAPELGGAERQSLDAAAGLRARGTAVEVLADPRLGCASPGLALPLAHDPARPAEESRDAQRAALAALLSRRRPQAALVACPLPGEGLGALEALHDAGVPVLALHHLVRADATLGPNEAAAMRGLRAGWAAVSAPGAARLARLVGLPAGAVAALPNGVASGDPPLRFRLDPPVLLQAGRLDERKGAHLAPDIARRIAPARLWLAGAGPLSGTLAPAEELGPRDDVPALMARADALCLPSAQEGCPLVVLEAAAALCPVIATPAALEAWPDAADWAWVAGRDVESVAAAFASILADPTEARRRAALARARLSLWDRDAMLDRLEALILLELAACPG